MPLDTLSKEAAKELFDTYYTYEYNEQDVANLLDSIGYHTLTVELFAKTLEAHYGSLSVGDLVEKVQRKTLNDPTLQRKVETEHHADETEVFLHLMLAFDCADLTPDETTLLGQLALLPPEAYTVATQLAPWLGYTSPEQKQTLHATLAQLIRKGWLTQTNHTYTLHRLIQQVITYQIPFDWETTETLVVSISNLLSTVDNPNETAVYPLRRYGEFLLSNIPERNQSNIEAAALKSNLAAIYQDLGQYIDATNLLEAALKAVLTKFGKSHPELIKIQSNLAVAYQYHNRYIEAKNLLEDAIANAVFNFGANHHTVETGKSNLAIVYKELGFYREAVFLLEDTINSAKVNLGNNHPTVAKRQSNLAMVYKALGQHKLAASLLERALEINQSKLEKNHPHIAINQSNLAQVYQELGRNEEAAKLLESAIKSALTIWDATHPVIIMRQSILARIYRSLGRHL